MQRFYQYNVRVTAAFDLNLFPFYRIKGQEWPQIPGLLAMTPPRRTARGREDDRLLIYLTFSGNDVLSASEYDQFTTRAAQQFYQITGSVTSAMRTVAQTINQMLVDRNLRTTGKGQYMIGRLVLGVLHGSQLVVAQCGPTHVFHLSGQEARMVHDSQISGRGLGIGQATPLYFTQLDLEAGDQLLLCADLPVGWEAALMAKHRTSVEILRRELFSITSADLNAILIMTQSGRGSLTIQKTLPAPSRSMSVAERQMATLAQVQAAKPAPPPAPSPAGMQSKIDNERPASRFARLLAGENQVAQPDTPPAETAEPAAPVPVLPQNPPADQPETPPQKLPPPVRQPAPKISPVARKSRFVSGRAPGELPEIMRPSARRQGFFRSLARAVRAFKSGQGTVSARLKKFLPNLFPSSQNGESLVGGSSLAFLAVAVPVILVTIAGLVYNQYGRTARYQEYYNLAFEQAALAQGQASATDVRHAWEITLHYLDQADGYQVTQESLNLRQQAQTALDNLDSIVRLDFTQAITGGLDPSVQITRMAATNTDLYLLDSSRGSVMRATLGNQGYEIDPDFECGPGLYNAINVGKLIDIEALQMSNDYNARLVAMDANGVLEYCGFRMEPVAVTLSLPPLGWQGITAFTLDGDGKYLYVLDPAGNAVWAYQGSSGEFIDLPKMFFAQQVPQGMGSAIDIAANNSDLYLLFQDGHVTACPESRYEVVPMRCADPLTFVDTRPGRQSTTLMVDAVFTQITFATAPDSMIYLLEPLTQAIFSFSSRSASLELRGQYRTSIELSNRLSSLPATAMNISPNRFILFSTGNQVYYARMP